MLGKFIECESDRNQEYYKIIQINKKYRDGKKFPIEEMVVSDNKIDLEATDIKKIGGFCISTYEYIFRWIIRGDTLCKVIIPTNSKIYKTTSENGIYLSEKIILSNPKKIDDNFAMELYLESALPEISYFKAMTACAIKGYINTALRVFNERVNSENVDVAISEFDDFCKRRENEYEIDFYKLESVKRIYNGLIQIREGKM